MRFSNVSVKSPPQRNCRTQPRVSGKKSKYVRCRGLTEEHIHGIANRIPECLIRHSEAGGIGAFNCVYEPPCQAWMFPFKFRKVITHIPGIIQVEIFPAHVAVGKSITKFTRKAPCFLSFIFPNHPLLGICDTFFRHIPGQQAFNNIGILQVRIVCGF